ncbi:gas vesicle protein [Streptomyces sp. NPDC052040]|uniref:gas vesicle protein n=1 Tax=Streptomyces sp. NPDC052040 TaxID=3365682 RepID=UPI0037CF0CAE
MTEPVPTSSRPLSPYGQGSSANLADILERVLDKGIVIVGDIKINLLDIELLTIKLRLLVASVDKAREIGIDWWEHDPALSSRASGSDGRRAGLEEQNERLRAEVAALRRQIAESPAEELAPAREPTAAEEAEELATAEETAAASTESRRRSRKAPDAEQEAAVEPRRRRRTSEDRGGAPPRRTRTAGSTRRTRADRAQKTERAERTGGRYEGEEDEEDRS